MMRVRISALLLALLGSVAPNAIEAQLHGGESGVHFVPWKVLSPDEPNAMAALNLFWLPASRDELRRSPLLTSTALALDARQCVAMYVVRPDDFERLARLQAAMSLPAAVLVDDAGSVVARAGTPGGSLAAAEVERMVHEAIEGEAAEADHWLDQAGVEAAGGRREEAVELYRRVCARRCMFPRKARDAERALHKLGVAVKESN